MYGRAQRNKIRLILSLSLGLIFAYGVPTVSAAQTLDCPTATTLEALVACIAAQMPGEDVETVSIPTTAQQADWDTLVTQMLAGQCDGIVLPASLAGIYTVKTFTDADNSVDYCVAFETADSDDNNIVDLGWGTFIINPTPLLYYSIDVSHPKHDSNTDDQGIGIFKGTGAYTYVAAGSHRHANSVVSACQGSFEVADVAHNTENFFHTAVARIHASRSDVTSLQFHGMGASTCAGVDVYMTHGSANAASPTDPISVLKEKLIEQNPTWIVNVPGDTPGCTLHGTTNTQGRLINGVAAGAVCGTGASSYTGRFIHVEQKFANRSAADWIAALQALSAPADAPDSTEAQTPDLTLVQTVVGAPCWYGNAMQGCVYQQQPATGLQTGNPFVGEVQISIDGHTFCLDAISGYEIIGALINQTTYVEGGTCYTWQPDNFDYRIDWFVAAATVDTPVPIPTATPLPPTATATPLPTQALANNGNVAVLTPVPLIITVAPTAVSLPTETHTAVPTPTATLTATAIATAIPTATSTATTVAAIAPSKTLAVLAAVPVAPTNTTVAVPLLATQPAVETVPIAPALSTQSLVLLWGLIGGSVLMFGTLAGMFVYSLRREKP